MKLEEHFPYSNHWQWWSLYCYGILLDKKISIDYNFLFLRCARRSINIRCDRYSSLHVSKIIFWQITIYFYSTLMSTLINSWVVIYATWRFKGWVRSLHFLRPPRNKIWMLKVLKNDRQLIADEGSSGLGLAANVTTCHCWYPFSSLPLKISFHCFIKPLSQINFWE